MRLTAAFGAILSAVGVIGAATVHLWLPGRALPIAAGVAYCVVVAFGMGMVERNWRSWL